MLATHMDEIGLMVAGVKHGFIHLVEMGDADVRILPARGHRSWPSRSAGPVASTPPHL
jgi:putative aminopeptidase FrvX